MFKILRLIRTEEWVALVSAGVVTLINIIFYGGTFSVGNTAFTMFKYFSFGTPFFEVFFFFIWGFCFWKLYFWLVRVLQDIFIKHKEVSLKERAWQFLADILVSLRTFIPFVVVSIAFYQLLDNLSYQLRFSGADMLLAGWDEKIFSVYPFVWLSNAFDYDWLNRPLFYIYIYISVILSGTFIMLFLFSRDFLFRRAVLAFIAVLIISFPVFYFLPCQDPSNYFLRNIRGYSFSTETSSMLKDYAPNALTAGYISQIAEAETNVSRDNAVPISCFPSMHAAWSFLIVYFLAKLRRWSLFLSLPWLALLLLSGIYFAQHYAVDYLIVLPIVVISLFLANLLIKQRSMAVDNISI